MSEKKRTGLHKGIETLFPGSSKNVSANAESQGQKEADNKVAAEAVKVKITEIEPNRSQPRKMFDEEALQELSDSIKQYGLLQPILVQDKKDHYEIIAGERRWRASRLAGLKEVPVIIRNYTDQEIVELSLIENIQREDLNPIEEAEAYQRLLDEFHLKQEDVAKRVAKNRTTITNALRLLRLSPEVRGMVIDGRLSAGHARTLVPVEDPTEQTRLAVQIVSENLSVRETEKLVKNLNKPQKTRTAPVTDEGLKLIYRNIEEQMRQSMGTKVSIKPGAGKGGKIEISYYNQDDLERISDLISKLQ
ncbi:MAG: ParB/RepB/Spo0J family partition protein [Lachnospiraceae bacterium]|nr:ParB/RepB/Spo0J family partition protein [Lachnospiraceae bacterium]